MTDSKDIYEFEDAVRFVRTWTEVDGQIVRKVLSAKERYLELAGIIDVDEDDALLRERAAYSHLLPDIPDTLDDRETEYVQVVTGVDEATVIRVFDGETAYADSIGIIEWPSEEARDETLGAPGMEAATRDVSDEANSMHEGHGNHWECVLQGLENGIAQHIPQAIQKSLLTGSYPSPCPDFEKVHTLELPYGGALATLLLIGETEDQKLLASGYPIALKGRSYPLEITKVRRWQANLEAIVEASIPAGGMLGFFDTSYFAHPESLREDETVEVELAAFAYRLEQAPEQVFEITQEEAIRQMRAITLGIQPEEVEDLSPMPVHSKGMACLLPHGNGNPDDCEFQGPVEAVDVLEGWDQIIYRLDVTVLRHDEPFTIPIYAARHTLPEGYTPKVGDDVRGVIWMQGRMANHPGMSE